MKAGIKLASKFGQIVDILKTAIVSGEFAEGVRITSENDLSRKYGISRNTVREAISSLVQQGYLARKQGKGTFVISRHPQAKASRTYAMFVHAHGHVYEGQTRALIRAFQQKGAIPVVIDMNDIQGDKQIHGILSQLLERGLDGVVLGNGVFKVLKNLCQQTGHRMPVLAVLNSTKDHALTAQYVLADFEYGTRMGTQYLLSLGCRRILFVIHRYRFLDSSMTADTVPGLYGDAIRGYKGAMADAGLTGDENIFLIDNEFAQGSDDRARLKSLLSGPGRPDAVFAFGDNRAKHVIDIADEIGLRVPGDLSVIGYWNTPWAEMTRVPLTSISIREEEIARIAVEKLLEARAMENPVAATVILEPEMVIRGSCGKVRHTPS